jgi:hypothetical protein
MSETTTATWRFRIGQQVRWGGNPVPWYRITARRWIERQVMAPYAEYQIERVRGVTHWHVEADLDAPEPHAGEGKA